MAVGDLNGDGNIDFVISGQSTGGGGAAVYLGNGDGTFQFKTFTGGYGAPVLGDFNGDGNLDIATPNYQDSFVNVCFGNGDGTFQTCSSYNTGLYVSAVTAADVNGDGKLDLITDGVVVLLNKGDGTFSVGTTVQLGPYGVSNPIGVGDFNGDGILDLAVMVFNSAPLPRAWPSCWVAARESSETLLSMSPALWLDS